LDWKNLVWGVTYFYKFQPSEVWKMTLDDLLFWQEGSIKIKQWMDN